MLKGKNRYLLYPPNDQIKTITKLKIKLLRFTNRRFYKTHVFWGFSRRSFEWLPSFFYTMKNTKNVKITIFYRKNRNNLRAQKNVMLRLSGTEFTTV